MSLIARSRPTSRAKISVSGGNWWMSVPTNTWHSIPGTNYSTDCDFTPYITAGINSLGSKSIGAYGGPAADRIGNRFLWAAAGGGAGAHPGNEVGQFKLDVPGVEIIIPPDDITSLWWDGVTHDAFSHALNRIDRPNSSHLSHSLQYSPTTGTLMKYSSGQTWEWDAGNFANVFEAVVTGGSLDWEVYTKHPNIPSWNNETVQWRLTDWRDGLHYVARTEAVYTYNVSTKTFTNILTNPGQIAIGYGTPGLLESANKILIIVNGGSGRYEIDITTGALTAVTFTGAAEADLIWAPGAGMASDPVGDCLWAFYDNQKLYRLTRTGTATWAVEDFTVAGTPPDLYHSGNRKGGGSQPGIWNGFDFFPDLKGLAWLQNTDRDIGYIRLYN